MHRNLVLANLNLWHWQCGLLPIIPRKWRVTSEIGEFDVSLGTIEIKVGVARANVDGLGEEVGGKLEVIINERLFSLFFEIGSHNRPEPEEEERSRSRERRWFFFGQLERESDDLKRE